MWHSMKQCYPHFIHNSPFGSLFIAILSFPSISFFKSHFPFPFSLSHCLSFFFFLIYINVIFLHSYSIFAMHIVGSLRSLKLIFSSLI